jgi:hypothetical protein
MLKLSESILLGSLQIARGMWAVENTLGCAIGMALLANGKEPVGELTPLILSNPLSIIQGDDGYNPDYDTLENIYPWVREMVRVECPWCHRLINEDESEADSELVWHPFDMHVMKCQITLEQLCEWIATLEPEEQPYQASLGTGRETLCCNSR